MRKCLYCYQLLENGETDFHARCSKKMFGTEIPPQLEYSAEDMQQLAEEIIKSQITVTGVQPKLSLNIGKSETGVRKLTLVGLWGNYILKPPAQYYPQLPEVEDVTMHLAEIAGIITVPHCLIRLQSGELSYITKRVDRSKKETVHMEDMCQLTERLTEHKYRGSYEQIAKAINKYSAQPGLDIVNFYEIVLFSFLTGNADMHLKNFSLLQRKGGEFVLSPAYDLVATTLVNPDDKEETALTLNARKTKLKRSDFEAAFHNAQLNIKQQENIFEKMSRAKNAWLECISRSFLSPPMQQQFAELIETRMARLGL
ncbi:MAG: HipA domain-containing protein [Bacteroidetes bacterium]|nr:HipA domain-containing protein [Bacteroidota bacterium]